MCDWLSEVARAAELAGAEEYRAEGALAAPWHALGLWAGVPVAVIESRVRVRAPWLPRGRCHARRLRVPATPLGRSTAWCDSKL